MSPSERAAAALAALLWPERAERLAALGSPPLRGEALRLAGLSGEERLASLAEALGDPDAGSGSPPGLPSQAGPAPDRPRTVSPVLRRLDLEARRGRPTAARTGNRAADAGEPGAPGRDAAPGAARLVMGDARMLPFDLPALAPALVEIDPSARALGERAAAAAGAALGEILEVETRIQGRVLRAVPQLAASAEVAIDLPALPAQAVLAVDCGLAAALARRLAGDGGARLPATLLTHAERAVLDLLVLAALDGVARVAEVASLLAPRLGLRPERVERPVPVEIAFAAGGIEGRAVLLLPARAVAAARGAPELPDRLGDVAVLASVRSGASRAPPREVAAARPGDVVPLDEPPGDAAVLALPGGAAVRGRIDGDVLRVEEVDVSRIGNAAAGLPVSLEVDLGSVAVPLRELARLEPGGVLPLPIDRSGRVTLRLGERALARGELVDLDGGVGVRIVVVEAAP